MDARLRQAVPLALAVFVVGCSAASAPSTEQLSVAPAPVRREETPKTPRDEIGEASFYAGRHHGKETASGEPFDQNALTAAHKSLPFGSRVEITNLENDRSVVVRVNDRGPFVDDRIIDVSLAAAKALDMKEDGVVRVRLRQVQ
jgi:rare lipoprotein A